MSRSIFGWSLPPGVTNKMIDDLCEEGPCEVCAKPVDSCICHECPVCHEIGRSSCYKGHGMKLSKAQMISRQEVRVSRIAERLQEEKLALEILTESEKIEWDLDDDSDPWA
jgi:hypothetical protein